jgi:hypothetical protein
MASRAPENADRPQGPALRLLPGLSSLSFAVQSAFDAPGLVAAVARHVMELARADTFSLLLLDYETGELQGDNFDRGESGPHGSCRVSPRPGSFLAQVLRRETLIIEDAGSLRRSWAFPSSWEPRSWAWPFSASTSRSAPARGAAGPSSSSPT